MGTHKTMNPKHELSLADWVNGRSSIDRSFAANGYKIVFIAMQPITGRRASVNRIERAGWFLHVIAGNLVITRHAGKDDPVVIRAGQAAMLPFGPYTLSAEELTRCIMISIPDYQALVNIQGFTIAKKPAAEVLPGVEVRRVTDSLNIGTPLPYAYDVITMEPYCSLPGRKYTEATTLYVALEGSGWYCRDVSANVQTLVLGDTAIMLPQMPHAITAGKDGLTMLRVLTPQSLAFEPCDGVEIPPLAQKPEKDDKQE